MYGPIFTLFTIPYNVHPDLPRFIFVLFWGIITYWLLRKALASKHMDKNWQSLLLLISLYSPFLWIRNVFYAQFDVIVAVLLIAAIEAKANKASGLSGIMAALAVSFKYYALAIIPFLSFREKKLDNRFIFSFGISLVLIYSLTYLKWGSSFLTPLIIMADRPSKLLSIFRFHCSLP